ncbi:MAG: hypothetical protein G5663_03795 [Serratia symbiotica]|nr:hypothetical protein [Serratia symbiotica]
MWYHLNSIQLNYADRHQINIISTTTDASKIDLAYFAGITICNEKNQ